MARDINVTFSNYSASGVNVTMPQVSLDVTITWKDEAGVDHTNAQTVLFPNILGQVPVAKRDDVLQQIILMLLRLKLGIDL